MNNDFKELECKMKKKNRTIRKNKPTKNILVS